jgi:hypothetical protein
MVQKVMSNESMPNDLAVSIAAAMTLAGALIIGYSWGGAGENLHVPLFDIVARSADVGGLMVLKLILFVVFCLRGMTSSVFLLAALSVFYYWLARYSATGAFFPQVIFNCLLLAAAVRPNVSRENRRSWAAVFLSIVFLSAAIQKMNVNYLAGFEFQSVRGFIGPFRYHFGELPSWLATGILPWLSILIEIGIGVGVLVRPKLFSQLALGFILSLFFINPHLHLPYLTLSALSFLIYPESAKHIFERFQKVKIDSPFFWFFILVAMANLRNWINRNPIEFFALPWIFSLTFLWIHGRFFLTQWQVGDFTADSPICPRDLSLLDNKPVAVLLSAMLLSPVGYALGLPAPIGFSMFSAKQLRVHGSEMKIEGEAACQDLERHLQILVTTDVAFHRQSNHCRVIAPTQSGLGNLKRRLCQRLSMAHSSDHSSSPKIDGSDCSVE